MSRFRLREGSLSELRRILPAVALKRTVQRDAPCPPTVACLIATKRGLYHLAAGTLTRLLGGEFYGLTRRGSHWYVYQTLPASGRLLRFDLNALPLVVGRPLRPELPRGCHQIDFVGDDLYVTDTYDNRLAVLRVEGLRATLVRETWPAGRLPAGRSSDNYVHMNSIWRGPRGLMAVFHNETRKSDRNSEIAWLDEHGELVDRTPTAAAHAHNVIDWRGKPLYCDSQHSALRWGEEQVFECDLFTRGLAITPEHILLGGSAYGKREQRSQLGGKLYVLDHDFRLRATVAIPAMVQEIRALGPDVGLSHG